MVILTDRDNLYSGYEKKFGHGYIRKCINGKNTGCGNCVGYCQFKGHSGFLTSELCKEHNCIEKNCLYFVSKPKRKKVSFVNPQINIAEIVNKHIADYHGMKVIRAEEGKSNIWNCFYVAVTNAYSIEQIENNLSRILPHTIKFIRLNYDFDKCAELILRA